VSGVKAEFLLGIEPAIKPAATNSKLKDRNFGHSRNLT
jgi:hypothetical protein